VYGGRHELGQNFLVHTPTLDTLTSLVAETSGPVLEIGAGDGALTHRLAGLNRPLTAIDVDEHRVRALRRSLPDAVRVEWADVMRHPLRAPVLVGNLPFHLTTPVLRRLLRLRSWREAVLLLQWEVARKRAGVGGRTLMSVQAGPWFDFDLVGRVPARAFRPVPSVDGGILRIRRRTAPLVPAASTPPSPTGSSPAQGDHCRGCCSERRSTPSARCASRWQRRERPRAPCPVI
jgi:23S rRNA (adenine-N6)-dimethyltransferase